MIVISINPTNLTASAVPTNKCIRIGQQQQIGHVVYTCVKSGKKLAWDKGSKILPSKIELVKSEFPKNYVHQNQEFEFKVTLLSNYSIRTIQGNLSIPARNSRIEFNGTLFDLSKNTGLWSFRIAIPSNFIAGENKVQVTATDVKGFTKTFDLQTVDVRLAIPDVPQVTPTPTPSINPNSNPSDKLSYKKQMIYGLENGMLTRRSDAGIFFNKDSRQNTEFSNLRLKAYSELNPLLRNLDHPKITINYVVRDSFPKELVSYAKNQFEEAAAFWNPYLPKDLFINIYLLTEKDRDYVKTNRWLGLNLPAIFDRFDSKAERPFISGGGRYWQEAGKWEGNIYLATASYLDLSYVNYEWPQVAKHEFTHVIQDYFFSKDGRFGADSEEAYYKLLPTNFMEGSANTIGYLTGFRNLGWSSDAIYWLVWQRYNNNSSWMTVSSKSEAVNMMKATEKSNPEGAFEMSYAIGALMFEWLIGNYGLDGYLKLLNQLSTSASFDESLKNSIGLSQSQFYDACSEYVYDFFKQIQSS